MSSVLQANNNNRRLVKFVPMKTKIAILDDFVEGKNIKELMKKYGLARMTIIKYIDYEIQLRAKSGDMNFVPIYNEIKEHYKVMDSKSRRVKRLTLKQKIEILDALAMGESKNKLAKAYNVKINKISLCKTREKEVRKKAAKFYPLSLELMEQSLYEWITNETKKCVHISNMDIRVKALEIIEQFKTETDTYKFDASNFWLFRFKRRFDISSNELYAPILEPVDERAANFYQAEFNDFIECYNYKPEQVFNIDEVLLFWKRVPLALSKPLRYKVTVLLCCNATGQMFTPMVVYNHQIPENDDIDKYAIFCRFDENSCVTETKLLDWFQNCFIPEVEQYLTTKNLPFKVLLLVDDVATHLKLVKWKHPNILVRMMPPKTHAILQPLEQGPIDAFRRHYFKYLVKHISTKIEMGSKVSFPSAFKEYQIVQCISIIKKAIDDLKPNFINESWKNLWPNIIQSSQSSSSGPLLDEETEFNEILEGLQNFITSDQINLKMQSIKRLVYSHFERTDSGKKSYDDGDSNAENIEMNNQQPIVVKNEADLCDVTDSLMQNNTDNIPIQKEKLDKIISSAEKLGDLVKELDPLIGRSSQFMKGMSNIVNMYKNLRRNSQ